LKSKSLGITYSLVLFIILNSTISCFVPGVSANEIILTRVGQLETGDAYDVWVDSDNNIAYVTCGYS